MPAHSCSAIWFGPEKSSYGASTEISFREASGPENEKSNLRLPSLRAWNRRYRIVDFGSSMNLSLEAKIAMVGLLQFGKYFCHTCPALNGSSCDWAQRAPRESWDLPFYSLCPILSMRTYPIAYSWATLSEIPLQ